MSVLALTGVAKSFSGVKAVQDVTFDVSEAIVFGLIGPNGAGKTTLVNLVTGYMRPDAGDIRIQGRSVIGMRPDRLAKSGVARTYQNLRLFASSTVLENVLIGRHRHYSSRPWDAFILHRSDRQQLDAARELLHRVGLDDHRDDDVDDLPYGLRRRVEIARALATEPSLLLLDEPTAGMTRAEAHDIGALIRSINDDGVSVLLVEHNVGLVTEVCDEVAVIEFGKRIAQGPPREVWADERVRTAYLGTRRKVG